SGGSGCLAGPREAHTPCTPRGAVNPAACGTCFHILAMKPSGGSPGSLPQAAASTNQSTNTGRQTFTTGRDAMGEPQVLIVGAGPTGLALALWLARAGTPFRLIDRKAGPGEGSRAMAVQARTLEFYRQLGVADEVIAGGFRLDRLHLRNLSREMAAV